LDRVRAFVADTGMPLVSDFEREHPDSTFALEADGRLAAPLLDLKRRMQRAAAEAGLYCPHLPQLDGGLGLGLVDCFYLQEEIYSHGLRGLQWALAWTDGPSPLVGHWSEASRREHLAGFVAGRTNVAFALTEPGAGSDVTALETAARRDGDGWVLEGTKHLITAAPHAELAQVVARVEGDAPGDLTAFLVPLHAEGVFRGPVQQTIMADGQTGSLRFAGVRVAGSAVIGAEREALALAFLWINWARTRRGGMCSGLAHHCVDRSFAHAARRRAFGRRVADFGAVESALSDAYMQWRAMRALSLEILAGLDAARIFDGRVTAAERRDISVLKTFNDEALFRIADQALQVHGGVGLLTETGLEKIFRVARNLRIPAGTSEVQRSIIARSLVATEPAPTTSERDT
jgi:alkylation response protein AidB-like acyl-CoA dehydrogenase